MYRLVRRNDTFCFVEESPAAGDVRLIRSMLFPESRSAGWGMPSKTEKHTWYNFVNRGTAEPSAVSERILTSWRRCRDLEVDPVEGKCDNFLSERDLIRQNQSLVETAGPIISTIYSCLHGSDSVIVLIDSEGYILKTCGDLLALRQADKLSFGPGANWSERSVGTNAIGTSLALSGPVQVTGAEHYCETHHRWTCAAAPIRDHTGKVIGFIDISGPRENANPHQLGLVVAAAHAIEERICLDYAKSGLFETNKYLEAVLNSVSEGVIATNAGGVITGINKVAAKMLSRNSTEVVGRGIGAFLFVDEKLDGFFRCARPSYSNEALILKTPQGTTDCVASANRVMSESGFDCGVVLTLKRVEKPDYRDSVSRRAPVGYTFREIIGTSRAIVQTIEQAKQVARSHSGILILGESGTGKEILAQAIHNASNYCRGPFVSINCGAIPKELIQSELFGYAGGAFTGAKRTGSVGKFQMADGGTLFLDEIAEMPFEMQVNLLRVLEERTVTPVGGKKAIPIDVRIIAASNKDLNEEVSSGRFREDLYYRLNVISITLPPLKARKSDIPLLAEYYLKKTAIRIGKDIPRIDQAVFPVLESHNWPGNVRELINAIEHAVNFVKGNTLHVEHLPHYLRHKDPDPPPPCHYQIMKLSAVEKGAIETTLRHFHGNISRTAKALGVGRNTLYEKIRKYHIDI